MKLAGLSLAAQLQEIQLRLSLPEPLPLRRAKSTQRGERSHDSELIGPAERAVIDAACQREIELLGYQFGAASTAQVAG